MNGTSTCGVSRASLLDPHRDCGGGTRAGYGTSKRTQREAGRPATGDLSPEGTQSELRSSDADRLLPLGGGAVAVVVGIVTLVVVSGAVSVIVVLQQNRTSTDTLRAALERMRHPALSEPL